MPFLPQIAVSFLKQLQDRLGTLISDAFILQPTVVPVAIVAIERGDISLQNSAGGEVVAPAANATIAELTGISPGVYFAECWVTAAEAAWWEFRWQNAGQTNTRYSINARHPTNTTLHLTMMIRVRTQNDRLDVISRVAGGAGVTYNATMTIWST